MWCRGLLALLLCCSLAGCGDDEPKPKFEPRTETSSSTPPPTTETSEPGPVEPEMPALARKHSTAGAEAFVEFYWELADYALATGTTGPLKKLASPACKPCSGATEAVDEAYAKQATITGGDTTVAIDGVSDFELDGAQGKKIVLDLSNTKQVIDFPGSRPDKVFPADVVRLALYLGEVQGGWIVTYLETP